MLVLLVSPRDGVQGGDSERKVAVRGLREAPKLRPRLCVGLVSCCAVVGQAAPQGGMVGCPKSSELGPTQAPGAAGSTQLPASATFRGNSDFHAHHIFMIPITISRFVWPGIYRYSTWQKSMTRKRHKASTPDPTQPQDPRTCTGIVQYIQPNSTLASLTLITSNFFIHIHPAPPGHWPSLV